MLSRADLRSRTHRGGRPAFATRAVTPRPASPAIDCASRCDGGRGVWCSRGDGGEVCVPGGGALAMPSSDAHTRLATLLADFEQRTPPVRVVRKDHYWHQRLAARLLAIVTLGGQHTYLSHYVTTLGNTIYVPDGFDGWRPERAWEVLRHEAVHVAQFRALRMAGHDSSVRPVTAPARLGIRPR